MSQFKRFNASENDNYNSSDAYPEGTLTWDPSNGLRIHDGNTSGGNAVSASTGYTRFLGTGIGSYDTNNSTSYNMTISPNWDGDFTGNAYITLPSNENFGSPLQIVQNSTGGVQIITQNDAAWSFEPNGNLILPVNGDIKDRDSLSVLGKEPKFTLNYQSFNAMAGTRYCIDSLGQAVTATLPATPAMGDAIYFVDAFGTFNTNNLTIDGNGKNIMGSSTLVASTDNQKVGVFYNGAEWRTY